MIEINKIKAIKVNNYKELSNAFKQFFVEHILSNNYEIMANFHNGVIDKNYIISLSCEESLEDFMSSYNVLFCGKCKARNNFFKKISSGNLIKCNFPAIVTPSGIIEMSDVLPIDGYESEEEKDFLEDNCLLSEIYNKMKKDVFVYLGTADVCFMPIKKPKEEVVDFIKRNCVVFPKKINSWRPVKSKEVFAGIKFRESNSSKEKYVYFSNSAKNDFIEEICSLRF